MIKRFIVTILTMAMVITSVAGIKVTAFAEGTEGAPAAENTTPVAENTAPVAESTVPVAENTAPVAESTTPVAESTTPVTESAEPAAEEVAAEENITETGNGLVKTDNSDGSKTVEYDLSVTGMTSEESLQKVVDEKTTEQEEIKSDVESQNGTYTYEITTKVEEKEEDVTEEKSFESQEKLDDYVTELATQEDIKNIEIVTTEQGVTAEQVDFDGYHVNEDGTVTESSDDEGIYYYNGYYVQYNGNDSYNIVITGGVETITIDLSWLAEDAFVRDMWGDPEPGDGTGYSVSIINESGDVYETTEYNTGTDGPYRYCATSKFKEEWGTVVSEENGRTYYVPNDIRYLNGRLLDLKTTEAAKYFWPNY